MPSDTPLLSQGTLEDAALLAEAAPFLPTQEDAALLAAASPFPSPVSQDLVGVEEMVDGWPPLSQRPQPLLQPPSQPAPKLRPLQGRGRGEKAGKKGEGTSTPPPSPQKKQRRNSLRQLP